MLLVDPVQYARRDVLAAVGLGARNHHDLRAPSIRAQIQGEIAIPRLVLCCLRPVVFRPLISMLKIGFFV